MFENNVESAPTLPGHNTERETSAIVVVLRTYYCAADGRLPQSPFHTANIRIWPYIISLGRRIGQLRCLTRPILATDVLTGLQGGLTYVTVRPVIHSSCGNTMIITLGAAVSSPCRYIMIAPSEMTAEFLAVFSPSQAFL